jgi:hypothetical protein
MPESFEAGDAKPGYKGPVNSEGKMVYGKRNPEEVITQRQHRLYIRQLEGLTPRQLVHDHATRESVSLATAWKDWKAVNRWNEEDFAKDRDAMVSRLTSARWRLFNRSMSKGHFQTAASVLDSLSKTVRDGEVDGASQADVKLNISIEPPAEK